MQGIAPLHNGKRGGRKRFRREHLSGLAGIRPVDGAAAYDYQITDGAELPDTVTLRVCADGLRGSVRAALLQDGSAVPIEAERDGSYLVLTAPTAGTLLLSASGSGTLLPWVLAAAAAAVLLALLFLRRRRKKTNVAASV